MPRRAPTSRARASSREPDPTSPFRAPIGSQPCIARAGGSLGKLIGGVPMARRRSRSSSVMTALLATGLLVACTGACTGGAGDPPAAAPTGTTGGAFSFTAGLDSAVPSGQKAIVVWSVSSTSPDYTYAFGSGTVQGSQVSVSFSANPPQDALNAGK